MIAADDRLSPNKLLKDTIAIAAMIIFANKDGFEFSILIPLLLTLFLSDHSTSNLSHL